jgi:prophage DNA circulation protein
MADWRKDLAPKGSATFTGQATFRGVPFWVERGDIECGRRVVEREYPLRDDMDTEDLGAHPPSFTLDGYVIGADYHEQVKKLIGAFNMPGPGKLYHPWLGKLTVTITTTPRIVWRTDEGGKATFSITCREEAEETAVAQEEPAEDTDEACDDVDAANEDQFGNDFSVAEAIQGVISDTLGFVSEVASVVREVTGYVKAAVAMVEAVSDAIATAISLVGELITAPVALAKAFKGAVGKIVGAVEGIGDSAKSVGAYFGGGGSSTTATDGAENRSSPAFKLKVTRRILVTLADGIAAVPAPIVSGARAPSTRKTRSSVRGGETAAPVTQQEANREALQVMATTSVLTSVIRYITTLEYESRQQAEGMRDDVLAVLDPIMLRAGDLLFPALQNLRAVFVRRMDRIAGQLPDLSEHTPAATLPAVLIAYQLYGDPERDLEIVARNQIANPSRVPGGVPLQVLTDG